MTSTIARSAVILLAAVVFAQGVFAEEKQPEKKYGYKDTPMLPDSRWHVHDPDRPQAAMVEPGKSPGDAPADAIILFDGTDLSAWEGGTDEAVADGAVNMLKTNGLRTKQAFGDCQLHIEWRVPSERDGNDMNWGNSGIFLQGRYELQVIESRETKIYADGISGAIYGQTPPMANPSRKPGEWETYDVIFTAPRFDVDKLAAPARMTVLWNGVLVQYDTKVLGDTLHKTFPTYRSTNEKGPITLQKHGSAVEYRNIWIRPLDLRSE